MIDIKIISATDRPNSNASKIAAYVKKKYSEHAAEAETISLQDFPLADVAGGNYGSEIESVKKFRQPVIEADGLVFVIPEYNGSFPGILKIFVDYLPFPEAFEGMPMSFIGEAAGAFGALRAVEQFQMIAAYRNARLFPERVFIPRVKDEFDPESGLRDSFKQQLLDDQIKKFTQFVKLIRDNNDNNLEAG